MDIYDALASILGEDLAAAVIRHQGLDWAVGVANAKISEDEDPKAVATIRVWLLQREFVGPARAR